MTFFFGEEDYQNVLDEKDNLHTDLAIKDAKTNDALLKELLDYMVHHRDWKYVEFRKLKYNDRRKEWQAANYS